MSWASTLRFFTELKQMSTLSPLKFYAHLRETTGFTLPFLLHHQLVTANDGGRRIPNLHLVSKEKSFQGEQTQ